MPKIGDRCNIHPPFAAVDEGTTAVEPVVVVEIGKVCGQPAILAATEPFK